MTEYEKFLEENKDLISEIISINSLIRMKQSTLNVLKDRLLDKMEESKINKFEVAYAIIRVIKGCTVNKFSTNKFKGDYPLLFSKYSTETFRNSYLTITVGEKDEWVNNKGKEYSK